MTRPAAQQILKWWERPDIFVREVFKAVPDPWQDEALRAFPDCPRIAMKASKGPGKTTVLAWMAWNFLLTRPHPNIAATSVGADNLRDNLWKEMAVWRNKSPLLQDQFEWQKERIFSRAHPATWFMSARSWSRAADDEQIGNTLAGLHSPYIMFLIDEAGAIPKAITMSAEAALGSCTEGHVVLAGNTNMLEGALYAACVRHKALWKTVTITGDPDDPNRSTRVSLEWARQMIAAHGRDDPFVKVMVLGEWPKASVNALLGPDDVEAAMKRQYRESDIAHAARILGVDVARFGDDASCIFPRQGLVAMKPLVLRSVDGIYGAGQVARSWQSWNADACFIDNSGGYGSSWIDQLGVLNRTPIPIDFGGKAHDRGYANRRSEMYFLCAKWVKAGGALPPDIPELVAELSETCYSFRGDALLLEPKDVIKAKIGRSPDIADALALTFADPVASRSQQQVMPFRQREQHYDPIGDMLRGN